MSERTSHVRGVQLPGDDQSTLSWNRFLCWSDDRQPGEAYVGAMIGIDGSSATFARPRYSWVTNRAGKVHHMKEVIFRWNFNGGTRDHPQISYVTWCGRQLRRVEYYSNVDPGDRACQRCLQELLR